MNNSLLEQSFLTLCSNLTIASLVVASVVVSFMLPVQGQPSSVGQANAADYHSSQIVQGAHSRSTGSSNDLCQNRQVMQTTGFVSSQMNRHVDGSIERQPAILDLEAIIVDSVIFHNDQTDTHRLTFYLANCSVSSGMVQLRSEVLDLQRAISEDSKWERRRVPRYDFLVHSVSVPQGLQPSSVRIYLRADDSSSVIELEVAGSRIKKSAGYSSTGELYTDNRIW